MEKDIYWLEVPHKEKGQGFVIVTKKTGGGEEDKKMLTTAEEKLMALMSWISVKGLENVGQPGLNCKEIEELTPFLEPPNPLPLLTERQPPSSPGELQPPPSQGELQPAPSPAEAVPLTFLETSPPSKRPRTKHSDFISTISTP
ncbi:hypothetical protein FQR65_LT04022 [Abscondita terminalis]|nr:hypothetical protein FQR65_LT04022 [Abscondita terminalis]